MTPCWRSRKRLLKDNKDLSSEDVQKLKEIIQARFSGKTVDPFIQGVKNLNYIQVMGNFGSAITQLGDLAYSMHFNGFDNTFKALFNQKDNYDFVKYFNLRTTILMRLQVLLYPKHLIRYSLLQD